jgi:hypothetical protein
MTEAAPAAVPVDTCAAIWLVIGAPMSPPSRTAIAAAQWNASVYVSPITAGAATARAYNLAIVTCDSELIPYGSTGHIVTITA